MEKEIKFIEKENFNFPKKLNMFEKMLKKKWKCKIISFNENKICFYDEKELFKLSIHWGFSEKLRCFFFCKIKLFNWFISYK